MTGLQSSISVVVRDDLLLNCCLGLAVGALNTVGLRQEKNTRKKGLCERLEKAVLKRQHHLPPTSDELIERATRCFLVSEEVLQRLIKEEGANTDHTLLNLASVCLERIKPYLTENIFSNLLLLFQAFQSSDCYADCKFGERVFIRTLTEITFESLES